MELSGVKAPLNITPSQSIVFSTPLVEIVTLSTALSWVFMLMSLEDV